MAFAAIYVPDFSLQAAVRAEAALRGAALALVDGKAPALKVTAANEAALRAGVELGMARTLATQVGSVRIRTRSEAQERAAHAALVDLGWSVSPRLEDTALDTIVLDLAGLSSLFGTDQNIAEQLAQRLGAVGLSAQIAVASGVDAAVHAARSFRGITVIAAGEEAQRIGGLPVSALRPAAEILETLELWGVRTCAALAALPVLELSERLGQEGVRLHEWAGGRGTRSLVPAEPGTCFEEELELDDSVEDLEPLAFLLGRLLDQLCVRLAARSLAISGIRLRFALDPAGQKEIQIRNDGTRRKERALTFERVLALPVPMRDPKILLNLLRLKLQGDPPKLPILKILLAAKPARPRPMQAGLFLPAAPDPEKLEVTIARLANLVGEANVGSPLLVDTHRPGEFAMERYGMSREEAEKSRATDAASVRTTIGFRMFRPALAANVRLVEGRPKVVMFRGMRGEVVAASGPWRTSGDWWREDAWHQDEWDLELRFPVLSWASAANRTGRTAATPQHGLYRLYFDSIQQKWFVRGIYD
jgi:protein ImuB